STAPRYAFKAAFLLAPTANGITTGLDYVPLAVLLPSCDGDKGNLEGTLIYDHNRFGPPDDMAPRYQIMLQGANHDFFNTIWTEDDTPWKNNAGSYCGARPDTFRLSNTDQRRIGRFIINSFLRYHVGGEQQFAAWWNGTAQLPDKACPSKQGPCDERISLTVQTDASRRKLIQRFDQTDSLNRNALGGAIAFSGFDATARCGMQSYLDAVRSVDPCNPKRLKDFENGLWTNKGLLSMADHAELVWSRPDAAITTDLSGISAAGYDSLTFRIAVVRPIGQEVMVTLTDAAGNSATIAASDFSNALYLFPRPKADGRPLVDDPRDTPFADGQIRMLMNMVAIPLDAFEGVDRTKLT
ncbi:MAG: hypothetical protein ACRECY_20570, partial [Phyllobacterium sp.]